MRDRGRVLTWMAQCCVALALGAGSAAAQLTVEAPESVREGGRVTLDVSLKVAVPVTATTTVIRLTATPAPADEDERDHDQGLTLAELADYQGPIDLELKAPVNSGTDDLERNLTGSLTLQTNRDDDSEDEAVKVTVDVSSVSEGSNVAAADGMPLAGLEDVINFTITDPDEQTFEWDVTDDDDLVEGNDIRVTLETSPTPVNLSYEAALNIDTAGYVVKSPTDAAVPFSATSTSGDIVIGTPGTDGNRDDDTITLRALAAGTADDLLDPLEIEVADVHALPAADKITIEAFLDDDGDPSDDETSSVVEGGDPVHVTVTADRGDDGYPLDEALEVTVTSAGGQALDYRIESIDDIPSGKDEQSTTFRLWALADDDVGDEDLVLNVVLTGATAANGPGETATTFTITIDDQTESNVDVNDDAEEIIDEMLGDEPLNPDDDVMLDMNDVFDHGDDVMVSYGATVETVTNGFTGGAAARGVVSVAVSGDMVTITALSPGAANVTLTATATPVNAAVATRISSNVAQVSFTVTVEGLDASEVAVTLSGPEDPNLVEGMSYTLTATADRAIDEDIVVELLQTEGTASPVDYEVGPITIPAGETMGTTMLMVVDDGTAESTAETLVLEGRIGENRTNTVSLQLWDAAVPALPVLVQLLLAALLALGGYRRYRRR